MDAIELLKRYEAGERNYDGADLSGANLCRAYLEEANFMGADFRGADLREADLCLTDLSQANLNGANLSRAVLNRALLGKVKLYKTKLTLADLRCAFLGGADLRDANLSRADLKAAFLKGADLRDADLRDADLRHADLRDADLSQANLCRTDLRNTDLALTKLQGAMFDEKTKFPESFDSIKARMHLTKLATEATEKPTATQQRADDYKIPDHIQKLLSDQRPEKYKYPPARPGQDKFRKKLLQAYNSKCAISECEVEEVLEAAHIIPWMGDHSHEVWNGLLLRSDLHKLFDSFLLTIHPETYKVLIALSVSDSYRTLFETETKLELRLPKAEVYRPDKEALKWHYNECRKRGLEIFTQ